MSAPIFTKSMLEAMRKTFAKMRADEPDEPHPLMAAKRAELAAANYEYNQAMALSKLATTSKGKCKREGIAFVLLHAKLRLENEVHREA